MADAGARLEHQAREPADGDVQMAAIGLNGYEGAVRNIQLGTLDED